MKVLLLQEVDSRFTKSSVFDADGTICNIEKGTPASAVEAITKLVKNGHQGMAVYRKKQGVCA